MLDHLKIINNQILEKISPILDPLKMFDIEHFAFRRFFLDTGKSFGCSTHPSWIKMIGDIWVGDPLYIYDEEINKVIAQNQKYFWRFGVPHDNSMEKLFHKYNLWNVIVIYKKRGFIVEGYYFCLPSHSKILDFCLKNIDSLERYTHFFQEKTQNIKEFIENPPDIIETKCSIKYENISNNSEILDTFNKKTPLKKYYYECQNYPVTITYREWECLKHFSESKTLKETARLLQISPRTVESYIESIKRKNGLGSKSELVEWYYQCLINKISAL